MNHGKIEKNSLFMAIGIILMISVGTIVEIIPLYLLDSTIPPVEGVKPYSALELEGRDIYIREGCYNCHSQMIRPFRAETERYGHYSLAAESMYDHPFQWGSKRTGPDLARVGGKYPDPWHEEHLINPRSMVPESIMPAYSYLDGAPLDTSYTEKKMRTMISLGVPYTEKDIQDGLEEVKGATEMEAIVTYLQSLGRALREDS